MTSSNEVKWDSTEEEDDGDDPVIYAFQPNWVPKKRKNDTQLTLNQALDALNALQVAFGEPLNVERLKNAKHFAGKDLGRVMGVIFPIVIDIEQQVAKKFGFRENHRGVLALQKQIDKYLQMTNYSSETAEDQHKLQKSWKELRSLIHCIE